MFNSNFGDTVSISFCAYALNFMNVRVHQPIDAMRMLGANVQLNERALKLIPNAPIEEPKILIIQRAFLSKKGWPQALQAAIRHNWLMVVEYDDYPENPFNAAKRANSLDWERFQACHAVQASTAKLGEAFLEHNPEVGVFQNHLFKMPSPVAKNDKNIRLFFGALNRKNAWEPLIKTYNKILNANANAQAVVLHDQEFFNALETENKVFKPSLGYDEYLNVLHSCHICLQPLDNTKFNRYKSDIKFVEAGAGGLAVVASPVVYEDYIEHGKTGLIARTPKEWSTALTKLIQDASYREQLGKNAKAYVIQNRMLLSHVHKRLDWYRHLWSNRDALNERIFGLYPDMRPS